MKGLLGMLFFGCFSSFLSGQSDAVEWTFGVEGIGEQQYKLTCSAKLQKGWYIYSQFLSDDGPIPTTMTLEPSDEYALSGDPEESGDKKEGHDELFDMHIVKFRNHAEFSQLVKLTGKHATIKGSIEYMTCDDHKCLPPRTINFDMKIVD